jgi:DNA repair protein RadC
VVTSTPEQLELSLPQSASRKRSRRSIPSFRVQVLSLVQEGSAPFTFQQLRGSYDVYAAFRDVCAAADREYFWTVLLDTKHKIIGTEEVARGSLSSTIVHPREVYKAALLANAAAIMLVHNHPSGDPTPSAEDIEITRRLRQVGELIGIRVLDHVIIGRGRYLSFVDDGRW